MRIAAVTEANVHRATFYDHFTSGEEEAYAISVGREEFQRSQRPSKALSGPTTRIAEILFHCCRAG
jgi:AcrR family transcriptional regulator